jgi:hypothetical protein
MCNLLWCSLYQNFLVEMVNMVETHIGSMSWDTNFSFCCLCGCIGFSGNWAYCKVWSLNYGSLFATCYRGWTSIATANDLYISSWGYFCLAMTYDANTFGIEIVFRISFLFLIIKCHSFSSSSFESFALLWYLVYNCFGDLMAYARRHLVFYSQSLNLMYSPWM